MSPQFVLLLACLVALVHSYDTHIPYKQLSLEPELADCPRSYHTDLSKMHILGIKHFALPGRPNEEVIPTELGGIDDCACQKECYFEKYQNYMQECLVRRDACDPCEVPCQEEQCNPIHHTGPATHTAEHDCIYLNQTACTCCVNGPDVWWSLCNNNFTDPVCGELVCDLCIDICGIPSCEWLDPAVPAPCPVGANLIKTVIQQYLSVLYSHKFNWACIPEDVWNIIDEITRWVIRGDCCYIDLSTQEISLLNSYVNGQAGTPVCNRCPSCGPPVFELPILDDLQTASKDLLAEN